MNKEYSHKKCFGLRECKQKLKTFKRFFITFAKNLGEKKQRLSLKACDNSILVTADIRKVGEKHIFNWIHIRDFNNK